MSSKITLTVDDTSYPCRLPYADADHCLVELVCPHCRAPSPIRVAGAKMRIDPDARHDTYLSDGGHLDCGTYLGPLRLRVSTIFGVEEDRAVLLGRVRVY